MDGRKRIDRMESVSGRKGGREGGREGGRTRIDGGKEEGREEDQEKHWKLVRRLSSLL